VDLHTAFPGSDESLDNHGILQPLVLNEEGVLRIVDEARDPVAAVLVAPDQARMTGRPEGLVRPVGVKAGRDFLNLRVP
jgi:hypothetical protein